MVKIIGTNESPAAGPNTKKFLIFTVKFIGTLAKTSIEST